MGTSVWLVLGATLGTAIAIVVGLLLKRPGDAGFITTKTGVMLHQAKKHLPLMVVWHPEIQRWESSITFACEWWNQQIDAQLIVTVGQLTAEEVQRFAAPSPGIVTVLPKAAEEKPHATLRAREDGVILSSPIFLDPHRPETHQRKIIVHELGHVLGLADDEDLWSVDSVMSPLLGNPLQMVLTKNDRELLRKWYA